MMLGPLKGSQGLPHLSETIRGGARSIKNQANELFGKVNRILTETKEAAGRRTEEKLDKKFEKIRRQIEEKSLDKKAQKVADKLDRAVSGQKRFPAQFSADRPSSEQELPNIARLKVRAKELEEQGQLAYALVVRDKIGQGLLQERGIQSEKAIEYFLKEAVDKFKDEKAYSKEDLGFMLEHLRNKDPKKYELWTLGIEQAIEETL